MAAKKIQLPSLDLSLIDLDSTAIAAIFNFFTALVNATPAAQHARNFARYERLMTAIESEVFNLPPLPEPPEDAAELPRKSAR